MKFNDRLTILNYMKNLSHYIHEALSLDNTDTNMIIAKDRDDLDDIIEDIIEKSKDKCIDLTDIDVSAVEDFSFLFTDYNKLKEIDISGWNMTNATDAAGMFSSLGNLRKVYMIDVNWSTIESITSLFENCSSLEEVECDMNSTTEVLTSAASMLSCCFKIKDMSFLKNLNVTNVNNFGHMFYDCQALKEIDISNWDMENVSVGRAMFAGCINLKKLDMPELSNLYSKPLTLSFMFKNINEKVIPEWYKKYCENNA